MRWTFQGISVVVQFYPWYKILFLFVLNSLSYITIPQNKGKQILSQDEV